MVGGGGILQDWLAERNLIPFISCNATRQQYLISNVCCLSSQGMWGHTTATRKFFWILCTTLKPPHRITSKAYNPIEIVPLRALDSSYWNINRQWAIHYNGRGCIVAHGERNKQAHRGLSLFQNSVLTKESAAKKQKKTKKWQDNINNNNKNTVTHTVPSSYGMHLSMYICVFPVTPEHSAEGCYHKCNFTDRRLTNTEDCHTFSQWFFSFFLQDAWIKRNTHSLWPRRCSPPGESWPVQSRPPWHHGAHPLECWLLAGRGGRSSLPPGTPLHLQSAAVHGKVSVGKCL